ncbi:MAG: iron ABC transporter permease [Chloroflexi bacterium]|nr:iron ABC transporter permease [Chloroflexota bacterium]
MALPTTAARLPRRTVTGPGRPVAVISVSVAVLAALGFFSLMYGAVNLSPAETWRGLTSSSDVFTRNVVWEIRYPRVVDGMLVGVALAVSGTLLQGVTRNPLADPTILGVTAAAALASSILLVIDPNVAQWAVVIASVVGGLVGAGILFVIAWRGAVSPVRLALAGIALSALFGAIIVGLVSTSSAFLQTNLGFLAGGLYSANWAKLQATLPYLGFGVLAAWAYSGHLNALALGDDIAAGLGVLTDRTRLAVLGICGVLTGAAVALAGIVGFVGLVSPHLARVSVGQDNRLLIPVAALYGAILVTTADLVARLIVRPSEVPMGIFTGIVGAPFLLYLVRFKS